MDVSQSWGWTTIRLFFCPPPFQPSQYWVPVVIVMLFCSMLEINDVVLYCIALYYIVLYCIVLYCIVLYCIVLHRIASRRIASYRIVLYCIVSYRIVLYDHLCSTDLFLRQAAHSGRRSESVEQQRRVHTVVNTTAPAIGQVRTSATKSENIPKISAV